MKYMGSKNRIAKYILPIMLEYRKPEMTWVEPFVGGANMIDKVNGKRIGADINPYLIEALIMIRDNPESIPDLITEDDYNKYKKELKIDGLTGFTGFAMSFGAKWFGGYRRNEKGTKGCIKNMIDQTRKSKNSALKQSNKIKGVEFINKSYLNLEIPYNSLIYCDPPYRMTTKYKDDFDHDIFWQWCKEKTCEGHIVFISEYSAPDDFKCIWQKEMITTFSENSLKSNIEKLFIYEKIQTKEEKIKNLFF